MALIARICYSAGMAQYNPFFIKGKGRKADIVICCDHGSNFVPDFVAGGDLGLSRAAMRRHIAYDIGAAGVAQGLGALLDAPVIVSEFSRLVIDPNRGEDDPTLIMRLSDGDIIPANRAVSGADRAARIERLYRPYHAALGELIKSRVNPCVISVHSFTRKLHNRKPRPWHIGVLFAEDRRLSDAVIARLGAEADVCVGINEPYCGHLAGDTMARHALQNGLRHVLIEVRNDLIKAEAGQREWSARLAGVLRDAIKCAINNKEASDG